MTVLGHQRGEDALAQAPVGHAQTLTGPHPEQRLENGAARKHKIGALMPDTGLRRALCIAHGDEIARHVRTSRALSQLPSTRDRS